MIEVLKQAIAWAEKHGEMVFASGGMDTVKSMNAWVMAGNQAIKDLESQEPVAITDDDGVAWAYGTKGGKLPANKVLYDKPYDVFEYLGYCPECGASPDNPQPHPPQRTEQEPVAWVVYSSAENDIVWADKGKLLKQNTPLYTTPPQRTEQEPVAWRELCRRLYVELFHCDQQMMAALDEDGYPIWQQGKTVRDVLTDAKTALETFPPQPEQEPLAIPDDVRKVAQAMQKDGYRGPLAWASKVIDFVADYTTPPQRTEQDGQCKRCTDGCPACDATKLQKESHDLL